MECPCARHRVTINCREVVFGLVIERILQALLDVAAALGLMLDIPACRAAQRLLGRQRIAVAELLLNLLEIHQLVMRCHLKADAARWVGDLSGQTDDLELMMQLVGDNVDNLTHE